MNQWRLTCPTMIAATVLIKPILKPCVLNVLIGFVSIPAVPYTIMRIIRNQLYALSATRFVLSPIMNLLLAYISLYMSQHDQSSKVAQPN